MGKYKCVPVKVITDERNVPEVAPQNDIDIKYDMTSFILGLLFNCSNYR